MINSDPGETGLQDMMARRMTMLGLLMLPAAAGAAAPVSGIRGKQARQSLSADRLAAAVQRLEDDREIRQLIDLHWLLADAGPNAAFVDIYTEDCVIDYARLLDPNADTIVEGRAAIRARYVDSPQGAKGRSHHLSAGPQPISITGDEARSVTYALVSSLKDGAAAMPLVEFNFWKLRRVSGRWRIARRSVRRLGDHDLLDLFKPIVGQVIGEAIGEQAAQSRKVR